MQVARRDDKTLSDLLAKFVCVRVVQMKGADLSLFQFDFDQTWAAFFVNADRTIYGRYGTRSSERKTADSDISIEGFERALEGALEIHAGYPANQASLVAKTGPEPKTNLPEKFPSLQGGRHANPLPQGCIHCHEVRQAIREEARPKGGPVPDEWLWVYPMPDDLGFVLDVKQRATVSRVAKGSAAEKAGLSADDKIVRMDGQPILSIADVQWVLEHAKTPGEVKVEVVRGGGAPVALSLALAPGWRRAGNFAWRESTWPLRSGMKLEEMAPDERRKSGGGKEIVGLRTKWVTPNGVAAKAGFKPNGDEILSVDGLTATMTESEFLAYLYQKKKPGEAVQIVVAHGSKRDTLSLPAP